MVRPEARPLTLSLADRRRHLLDIMHAGIAAAAASSLVGRALGEPRTRERLGTAGPIHLIAAGKAAAPMASAFVEWAGDRVVAGVVAGTHKIGSLPSSLVWYRCGHPLPDENSVASARHALRLAAAPGAAQIVCLLSGGASALLAAPLPGLSLEEKIEATRLLLRAGAAIDELNCVRKHLSAIKGGRLAAGAAAPLATLAISDVVGPVEDDPSVIGSGPTTADATRYEEALAVVRRYGVERAFPSAAMAILERGARHEIDETPKPGDLRLARARFQIIGSRRQAMTGAADAARSLGYEVTVLPDPLTGAARDAAHILVAQVRAYAQASRPVCVLASGETTVKVTGPGRGGRNQELALAAAPLVADWARPCVVASVGTDGVDGPTDAAGAVVDQTTLRRAARLGLPAVEAVLAANDSYTFFDALGDLVRTGPTETNVVDLQIALT